MSRARRDELRASLRAHDRRRPQLARVSWLCGALALCQRRALCSLHLRNSYLRNGARARARALWTLLMAALTARVSAPAINISTCAPHVLQNARSSAVVVARRIVCLPERPRALVRIDRAVALPALANPPAQRQRAWQ